MLAQKLILSYASRIAVQVVQIVASIIVARIAGPTVLGTVASGFAYVSIFSFIADLGLGTAHIKLLSEKNDFGNCLKTFTILKSVAISFFTLFVVGYFLFEKFIAERDFESTEHIYVIFISLVTASLGQFILIPNTTFMARTEQAKQDIPEFSQNLIFQVLRVVIVLLGFGAVALALGHLISVIIILPVVLYLMKDLKFGKFDKELAIKYIKIAVPVIVIGMASNVSSYVDVFILQLFSDSEQVGYYSAGYRVGGFVLMIANSIGILFFPLFSQAFARGDFAFIKDKIEKFSRFSFLFIMPFVIMIAVYSEVIVNILLGEQYQPSISVMSFITIAMFFAVLFTPYGNVLTGIGKFKLTAKINIIQLVFFIMLLIIMTNPSMLNYGASGVAIAVLASKIFLGFLFFFFAKKNVDILSISDGLKFLITGTILYLIFSNFYNEFLMNNFLWKLLFIPIFLFLIYFVFYLFKWIKKEDIDNLKTLIDIKAIGRYIKGEFRKNA